MERCLCCFQKPKYVYTLTEEDKSMVVDVTKDVITTGLRMSVGSEEAAKNATRGAAATKEPAARKAPAALSQAYLASLSVEALLRTINLPEYFSHVESVEMCFKQLRILCREDDTCVECDRLGANEVVISTMRAHIASEMVLTQACAVLINLCAGESWERRDRAQQGGAVPTIIQAMQRHPNSAILQEMSFVAMQNICFGNDPNGVGRRRPTWPCTAVDVARAVGPRVGARLRCARAAPDDRRSPPSPPPLALCSHVRVWVGCEGQMWRGAVTPSHAASD